MKTHLAIGALCIGLAMPSAPAMAMAQSLYFGFGTGSGWWGYDSGYDYPSWSDDRYGGWSDRSYEWARHVARCAAYYASYDDGADTFIDRYGRERHCRL